MEQYSDSNAEASRYLEWPDFVVIGNFLKNIFNRFPFLKLEFIPFVSLQPFTLWLSLPSAFM